MSENNSSILKVVAVDGAAGSGKSFLGFKLAQMKGWEFLDSGVIFRALAYEMLKRNIDFTDENAAGNLLDSLKIDVQTVYDENQKAAQKIFVDQIDVTDELFTVEVDSNLPKISGFAMVREAVKRQYQKLVNEKPIIIAGRDIGTVAFPNAPLKFYIIADAEVRARRRLAQRGLNESEYEKILQDIIIRDSTDMSRPIAPLKAAEDAVQITNNSTVDEALGTMIMHFDKVFK